MEKFFFCDSENRSLKQAQERFANS